MILPDKYDSESVKDVDVDPLEKGTELPEKEENPDKKNPYIKNIDYYSLAMIINYIYTKFIKYFPIVENPNPSDKKLPKISELPQLFENLVKQYNDNEIEKETFLEQFDKILSVIKD
jgi:hypothetical protein